MKLGLGCGALGDLRRLDERQAAALVDAALRVGVKVFDTARSYGESEGRLGRFLHRRAVTISTKGGYGVEPVREWTGAAITAGIERARHELGVDRLGLFHLHSCPLEVLQRPDLLEALESAKRQGLVERIGYAGDGEALAWAVECGRFDAFEASWSVFDQANGPVLLRAKAQGKFVLAKRPLGGAPWRGLPSDAAGAEYLRRMQAMAIDVAMPWEELAARFAAHASEVDVILVGTTRAANLERIAAAVEKGPLPAELDGLIRAAFRREGTKWTAQI